MGGGRRPPSGSTYSRRPSGVICELGPARTSSISVATTRSARLHTLPPERPQLYIAAAGPTAAQLAGRLGDGLIATSPDEDLLSSFEGGRSREAAARPGDRVLGRRRNRRAPNGRMVAEGGARRPDQPGAAPAEPFEQVTALVTEGDIRHHGEDRLRSGPPGAPGGHRPVRRRGVQARVRAPDRARSGGVPALLRRGDPAPPGRSLPPRRPPPSRVKTPGGMPAPPAGALRCRPGRRWPRRGTVPG